MMFADPWLERWLGLIKQRAGEHPVLEIGCGYGDDTATLAAAGLSVIGFDLSRTALAVARRRVPSARLERRDIREPLPGAGGYGVVLASLSLHYFPWTETVRIVAGIRDALRPDGILVCRLNSTEDRHFGAQGGIELEPGLFEVKGQPKRFFDRPAVQALFAEGWRILSIDHVVTGKYFKPKAAWEIVVERVPPSMHPTRLSS
ncbi:MAG: hypothetical protein K0R89_1991 [Ramlibacter sp.]|jgi:SAM-dependent methyltransferase|nr:hypothetical protein [Ramlibacter sp.]